MSEGVVYDDGKARVGRLGFESGLEEAVLGLYGCALGVILLPALALPKATLFGQHYAMIAPHFQTACTLAMAVTLKTLRTKLIFPRTGYVVFRPPKSWIWMMAIVLGLVVTIALAAAFSWSLFDDIGRLLGTALALVMVGCFVSWGVTYRMPHFLWLGGWALVLGIVAYILAPGIDGMLWEMIGIGVAMALSGAVRLKRFLKTHPVIEADHD
jgi:hypothetical protein